MARLLDYFGRRTNWQRRLWNPGTVTVLQETLEAVDLLARGHRAATVKELARMAQRRSGPDLGLGPSAVRSALTATLRKLQESPRSPIARHQPDDLLSGITTDYLAHWSQVLSSEPEALAPEEASRTLAGHLLGLGFSPDYLHRWVTWLAKRRNPASLAEVFGEGRRGRTPSTSPLGCSRAVHRPRTARPTDATGVVRRRGNDTVAVTERAHSDAAPQRRLPAEPQGTRSVGRG